jgi:EmrB/QacA subfamily drug resistance transporter
MIPVNSHARSQLLILLCVSVPSFMINLDANIVAVSLPSISESLKADFTAIEWVISAYTLTFASLVLPAGTLADRYGRKRILIIGLAIFTIASFFCGSAPNALVLNVARAVQGVGAALQLSAALAILSFEFRGPARARAFAFWGTVIGVAITLGPVAGGLITQGLGWQWAFYINLPVGFVMIALTAKSVTESNDPHAKKLDILGFLSFAGSLALLTLALISGNHTGWASGIILSELVGAVVLFGAFVYIETHQARPMLELGFFKRPTYIGANIASVTFAAAFLTMLTYLPLFFQSGLAMSPQKAGLMMLPIAIPIFIVPRLVARHFTHRMSGRSILAMGLAVGGLGLLWLSATVASLEYVDLLPGMLLIGIGAGFLNGETAKVAMTVIPVDRAGMAAGVGGTIRFAGIVIGFAALGAILFDTVGTALARYSGKAIDPALSTAVQRLVAGDPGAANALGSPLSSALSVASGYSWMFLTAAIAAFAASAASWSLVNTDETAPVPLRDRTPEPLPTE